MPSGSPQSTAVTAVRKRPRHTKRQLQEWRQGYVFLLPAVIILGIFIGISALFVIYLSFCKVTFSRTATPSSSWTTTCGSSPTSTPARRC